MIIIQVIHIYYLDRTLTFKTHLTKLKGKLSSRNNILHKLAGSSWGSDANTLRTSALALIFSTAEYCAPVWEGSCHTKLIDTQLNSTLRIITGVCQPTRIDWLPVLAHISPPELRRKEATKKMYQKLLDSPDLEINPILQSPPKHRLKSRKPIWSRGNQLLSQNFNISEAWTNSWISSDFPNKNLITSPSVKIPVIHIYHLDRTLTFKTHLTKLKGKLSSRNNILHKLAGSSWGSDANTLRTSALALIFSTAEYCAPVWEGSCHTKLIDTQLNSTLRIITGVCQPTRIDWLPVLAHISPPELRRKEATKKMYQKLLDTPDLEINPILQSMDKFLDSSDIPNKNLITSPSVKIPGFSLPRREWVLLNRFRTGQGRCAELMKLWGYTKDPNCACNVPQSMSHILDDCPLYKFNGGISNLHSVTPEALNWLKALPLRL
ncbi:hypothetical protein LAZ67_7002765 [Cordylochernes scorpioides]|uniref:Reverse transcriptase n=1 Tax=Cordylochernes scorpioides TaxID=51811 RepID=A0ABY6KNE3_9ARAC|nr:hypothetical protein LAZ67_7002765 [Cordylochernes scorpioides]